MGSSPLRSDGSRNGQAGEAGPVEQCSAEAKRLKTNGQGTVRLPPQWATTKAARRGARGPNKELLSHSHDNLPKETKQWVKGSPPKMLTLCSNLDIAVGDDVVVDEDVDE
jgi:hypothetical protein